jgi:hypothetical protein
VDGYGGLVGLVHDGNHGGDSVLRTCDVDHLVGNDFQQQNGTDDLMAACGTDYVVHGTERLVCGIGFGVHGGTGYTGFLMLVRGIDLLVCGIAACGNLAYDAAAGAGAGNGGRPNHGSGLTVVRMLDVFDGGTWVDHYNHGTGFDVSCDVLGFPKLILEVYCRLRTWKNPILLILKS